MILLLYQLSYTARVLKLPRYRLKVNLFNTVIQILHPDTRSAGTRDLAHTGWHRLTNNRCPGVGCVHRLTKNRCPPARPRNRDRDVHRSNPPMATPHRVRPTGVSTSHSSGSTCASLSRPGRGPIPPPATPVRTYTNRSGSNSTPSSQFP